MCELIYISLPNFVDMASLRAQDKETVEKVTWLRGYIGNLVMRVKKQEKKITKSSWSFGYKILTQTESPKKSCRKWP